MLPGVTDAGLSPAEPRGADGKGDRGQPEGHRNRDPRAHQSGTLKNAGAQEAVDVVNSEAFQKKLAAEQSRIGRQLFGKGPTDPDKFYADAAGEDGHATLAGDERIYIFISSSVPEATLRAYALDLEKLGSPNAFLVMRGMVGGMKEFGPTMKFLSRVLLRDPDCADTTSCPSIGAEAQIDPMLFRRFKPESVPAVVFARGVRPVDPDHSEGDITNFKDMKGETWWAVYGDAPLSYSLGKMAEASHQKKIEEISLFLRN